MLNKKIVTIHPTEVRTKYELTNYEKTLSAEQFVLRRFVKDSYFGEIMEEEDSAE